MKCGISFIVLIKRNETFMFEGFQHIHSHFFHQETQWKKFLVFRSIFHRCAPQYQNNKIRDLKCLHYENCKCLWRGHYEGISWCIFTYYWKDIFLSWEIVPYVWSTFIVWLCIQSIKYPHNENLKPNYLFVDVIFFYQVKYVFLENN